MARPRIDKPVSNWQWRPAIASDIGSLARFRDVWSPHESWSYGILTAIETDTFDGDIVWAYECQHGGDLDGDLEPFNICEVQYDHEELP